MQLYRYPVNDVLDSVLIYWAFNYLYILKNKSYWDVLPGYTDFYRVREMQN